MSTWNMSEGVVELPSGRRIRGRSWSDPVCEIADVSAILTTADPDVFAGRDAQGIAENVVYISWPDGRIPRRPQQAIEQLKDLLKSADDKRIEVTSGSGMGRTGTALAIMAVLEGMEPSKAIDFLHEAYSDDAVMSHAQSGFLADMGSHAI